MSAGCRGAILILVISLCGVGCARSKDNTSFNITSIQAQQALAKMKHEPKPLTRPLVILSGYFDPGVASGYLRKEFRHLTGDERVLGVSFLFCSDFDECRKQVIESVQKEFPSEDPKWTTEVDVVAVSMGGLVARYAAVPAKDAGDGQRLRVARMFTISSPHRGASLAGFPTLSRLQKDMRSDSKFLKQLNEAGSEPTYELYPYVRLGDVIVGAPNAAPYGRTAWWVPGENLQDSHMMAMMDSRIIADVAKRLRGETPFAVDPPAPLPNTPAEANAQVAAECNCKPANHVASR
jgi:pimeloyl-ACP methyl ester carboxylesterase